MNLVDFQNAEKIKLTSPLYDGILNIFVFVSYITLALAIMHFSTIGYFYFISRYNKRLFKIKTNKY
jgi:hypothetical protein